MAKSLILKVGIKGAKKTTGALKSVGSAVTSIGKKAGIATAGLGLLSTKLAGDFQKSLLEVSTLLGKTTNRDLDKMSRELRAVAMSSGVALDSLSKAKYDIVSAGFSSVSDSAEVLRVSSELAVGGVTSVAEAADLLTTSLNALGLDASDTNKVADQLFTTVRLGKTTMTELSASLGQVLPFARSAGLGLDGVGAAMATLTASGISTAQATTSLRATLVSLQSPADSSKKAMEEAGIEIKRFDDGTLDLVSTIKQFQGVDPDTLKKIIPRVEAILGIQTMAQNFETLTTNVGEFATKSTGATQKAFDKMSSGFNQQMSMLKNSIQSVLIEIGKSLITIIQPSIESVNKEFAKLGEIGFDNLAKTIKTQLPQILEVMQKSFFIALSNIESRVKLLGDKFLDAINPFKDLSENISARQKLLESQFALSTEAIGLLFSDMYQDIVEGAELTQKEQEAFDQLFANSRSKVLLGELDELQAQLDAKRNIKGQEIKLEEDVAEKKKQISRQLTEDEIANIKKELEEKNIFYNATLSAHDQFIQTLTDANMHGAERRILIEEAVKNSTIRFIGEHTKAFIKNKFQEVAIQNATNALKEASAKSSAMKEFLISSGKNIAGVLADGGKMISGILASMGPAAVIGAPLVIAAVGALTNSLISQIKAGSGALGFAEGGIVPGLNTSQSDTVPAMLTPGEVILNQAQQENLAGGMGNNITVNISAPLVDETVVESIIPAINSAVRENRAVLRATI